MTGQFEQEFDTIVGEPLISLPEATLHAQLLRVAIGEQPVRSPHVVSLVRTQRKLPLSMQKMVNFEAEQLQLTAICR
jgi:hypothetical protein